MIVPTATAKYFPSNCLSWLVNLVATVTAAAPLVNAPLVNWQKARPRRWLTGCPSANKCRDG